MLRRAERRIVKLSVALFLAMFAVLELGNWLGLRDLAEHGEAAQAGTTAVESAIAGLLGLLVGFSFNGAAARFDRRRTLVGVAVTLMETGWQRIALLPAEPQGPIRAAFREYVDALIASYEAAGEPGDEKYHRPPPVARAQHELWALTAAACTVPSGEPARMLLVPAINEMFRAVEQERLARRIRLPWIIVAMLCGAALVSALLAGFGLANGVTRHWLHAILVAATVPMTIFVTLDLELPRHGLIRIDEMDRALHELRETLD